jgi:hypothetical protein
MIWFRNLKMGGKIAASFGSVFFHSCSEAHIEAASSMETSSAEIKKSVETSELAGASIQLAARSASQIQDGVQRVVESKVQEKEKKVAGLRLAA